MSKLKKRNSKIKDNSNEDFINGISNRQNQDNTEKKNGIENLFQIGQGTMSNSREIVKEKIDVILFDQYKNENTKFENVEAFINQNNEIIFSYLLSALKSAAPQMELEKVMFSYFNPIVNDGTGMYIYCGKEPIPDQCTIPIACVVSNTIHIKIRSKKLSIVDQLIMEQRNREENDDFDNKNIFPAPNKNRVKERKIGEVVEKVALWRRFYTGFQDDSGNSIHMPLDIAAQKVGISKKTLDDYLLQIRCGKKYGFDFNKHLGDRIGKLRSFVKQYKCKEQSNHHNNHVNNDVRTTNSDNSSIQN